jgi:uncharacterized protein HemX
MDINSIASIVSIVGVALAYFSFMKDKLKSAEEFGKLQQKVNQLENQARQNENRFQKIEDKLDEIQQSLTRLETLLLTRNND